MKIFGLFCPQCKKQVQADPHYEKDNFYVCSECGKPIACYCSGCEQMFYENRMILHDDLYVCKECGKPHYGYTDWKRA